MTEIFKDRTVAFDGSGSPTVGTATITIQYQCVANDAGHLKLYARTNGDTVGYNLIWDANMPAVKRFAATSLQYYFTWDIMEGSPTASLSTT